MRLSFLWRVVYLVAGFFALIVLLCGICRPVAAASHGFTVLWVPSVSGGTYADLGTVVVHTYAGTFTEGGGAIFKLLEGYSFNWSSDVLDVDPATGEVRNLNNLVSFPASWGDVPNAFWGQQWAAYKVADNEVRITLVRAEDSVRLAAYDGVFCLSLQKIAVPYGIPGDIILTGEVFNSPGEVVLAGQVVVGRCVQGEVEVSLDGDLPLLVNETTVKLRLWEKTAGSFAADPASVVLRLPEGYRWTGAGAPEFLYGDLAWLSKVRFRPEGREIIIDTVVGEAYTTSSPTGFSLPLTFEVSDPERAIYGKVMAACAGASRVAPEEIAVAWHIDGTPPDVVATSPADGASNVPVDSVITVRFGEPVQKDPNARLTIRIADTLGREINFGVDTYYDELIIAPYERLSYSTHYAVYVDAGAVRDLTGTPNEPFSFGFTTEPLVWPTPVEFFTGSPEFRVGGKTVRLDVAPYLREGRVMVPVRAISDALNLATSWSGYTQVITFERGHTVRMRVGSRIVYVGDEVREIDVAPEIAEGRVYVPAAHLAAAFGYIFDEDSGGIYLAHPDADRQAPILVSSMPGDGARDFSPNATLVLTFDERIKPGGHFGEIKFIGSDEQEVTFNCSTVKEALFLRPQVALSPGTEYQVIIPAGALTDIIGNALSTTVKIVFRTASTGVRDSGGGSGGGGGGGAAVLAADRVEKPVLAGSVTVASIAGAIDVKVPAGAVSGTNAAIKVEIVSENRVPSAEMTALSKVVDVAIKNGTLTGQVDITLYFDRAKILPNREPAVYYYNEAKSRWVCLGGTVDFDKGKITVTVDHLTMFAVFAVAKKASKPEVITFKDMRDHWAADTVRKLADMDIISGYPDGTFRPDNTITRAEMACIMARALKLAPGDGSALTFADKSEIPAWARGAVAAAARDGLFKGYPAPHGNVIFKPNSPINRAELAALLSRVVETRRTAVAGRAPVFADAAEIPVWARNAVEEDAASGIVSGYPDGTFRPKSAVTRAEAASMILRLLEKTNE
ncbi:hypothetical protein G7K71_12170 [Desulfofundulus sp. TPOSR]|uniref:S-layer homology domain-containing protein n=1 Tax=Desulfofundulus sp. TPOSR TaxID=2714340 RepID=UPI00140E87E7|nr:S-layer homology domain-containing protein [Desulfofundulus sp. TPOSR]NHM27721.1 hypothetical protein [Desulfofundulus sp. TPOSR]